MGNVLANTWRDTPSGNTCQGSGMAIAWELHGDKQGTSMGKGMAKAWRKLNTAKAWQIHGDNMATAWKAWQINGTGKLQAWEGPWNEWERQWKTLHGKDMATGDMATTWQRAFQRNCTMHAKCTARAFEGL